MIIPDDAIELAGNIFSGEYDVPKYVKEKPSILDLGANIGAFARWASYRWPGCTVECYEPIKANFDYLVENTKDNSLIKCYNVAVGEKAERRSMYYGVQNCGQCSFYKTEEQIAQGEEVDVVLASDLKYADVVKIDTEGAEVEIIRNLNFQPELFLVEYHSLDNRNTIIDMLDGSYTLIEFSLMNRRSGMLKLVKTDLIY